MLSTLLRLISSIVLLAVCLVADAQNRISVKEENFDDMETTAMVNPEKDRNNRDCALVIFHNVEPEGYYFDSGSVFIKAENHVSRENGEKTIFLYISEGAKVITIRHRSDGIVSLRYEFVNGPLQARHTYHVYLGHVEPVNSAARQYLTFEIEPPTASLEVEENPDREPGVFTPWALDAAGRASKLLGLGDYRYTVSAPDWHPTAGIVSMRDPNDATVERVRLKSSFGTLTLTGKDLAGATVFVDGRNAGSAGISGYRLAAGEHTVKITRPMYKLFTKTFTVREGEDTRLEIRLVPNFTSVELKCADSGADLFVREGGRDRLLGVGSAREPLEAGDYLIVAKRVGHRETTRRITVAAGGSTSFTIDAPVPMYGSINIVSVPSPAKIDLDGKPSGATPRMLNNVLVGSHRVKVYADGYAPYETTVNVTEGAMAEVKAELKAADKTPDVDISSIGNGFNPLPGSEVRTGKLDNGLTYYIYKSNLFPGKASYNLVSRAGSAVESPQEDGYTLLVNYIIDAPTTRFPNGPAKWLLTRGVRLWQNFNTFVGPDQTQCYISDIPSRSIATQDSCLMYLRDYMDGLRLDDSAVESAKKIQLQQLHLQETDATWSAPLKSYAKCFAGSRLENMSVRGSRNVVENATSAGLRDFYTRWRRSDLSAVMVAGDVDLDATEALIRKHFASLPKPSTPTPDTKISLPTAVNFVVEKKADIKAPAIFINMMTGGLTSENPENLNFVMWYLRNLAKRAILQRLSPTKVDGLVSSKPFNGIYDAVAIDTYSFMMESKGKPATAVANIFKALDELRDNGLSAEEFQQLKDNMLAEIRQLYKTEGLHLNHLVVYCYQNFIHGTPLPDKRLSLTEQVGPQISLESFNAFLKQVLTDAFTTCLLRVPEKSKAPTPESLRAAAGR